MSDPVIIKMRHIRAAKMCSSGVRDFCIRYNIDYENFLKNGITEEDLLKTNDAIILEVIKAAKNDK